MGSGKTRLGRRLAAALDLAFVDLDARLEMEQGRTIRETLAALGEPGFRQLELQLLRQVLREQPTPRVVATGGGIVEIPEALPLLRQLGRVVWLRADADVCVGRLGASRRRRPLLDDEADWRRRFAARQALYRQAAQCIVDTDRDDVDTCLTTLLGCLDRMPSSPGDGR